MKRNSDPWLRFYVRTLNNPKVQRLPGNIFKGWVNLLCLAKETDGVLPAVEDISFRLRLSKSKAESLLSTLETIGLIDGDRMHDWDEMQYSSDSSTERVKRHRERNMERSSNVSSNVSETVQSRVDKIRVDKNRTEPPISPKGDDSQFESFWNLYPKKVGKQAALRRWKKIKPSKGLVEAILNSIRDQVDRQHFIGSQNGQEREFIPNPSTWLNEGRWEDGIQPTRDEIDKRERERVSKEVRELRRKRGQA